MSRYITTEINASDGLKCGAFKRTDCIHCIIIVLVTFLVYAWSAPVTVGLEDDGYFILTAYYSGIAHPPGYPLYTLLAHVATLIPIGSVALRVHLLSGFLGALACACLWLITFTLVRDRTAAYAAALSLAFSRVFWSQAIVAEVYTLNVLLVLMTFLCVLNVRNCSTGRDPAWQIRTLFLCYGLALSNHWPLVVLTTPMFIAALWQKRRNFHHYFVRGLPFLLLGLTPYVWMAIRSQMNPEILFFGPIESIPDFWRYLSRQPYAEIDFSPSAGWIDKMQYLQYALVQTGGQFGPFGGFLILAGLICQKWRLPADLCVALILGYLGSTVFLILMLGFDYEEYHKIIFSVYPLIAYTIAAIWLAVGLVSFVHILAKAPVLQSSGMAIPVGCAALVAGSILSVNAAWNYRHDDDWARLYAVTVLNSLPRGAILFSDGLANGAIAYLNKIEGYRKDITLFSVNGILFKNRFFDSLELNNVQARKAINEFIKKSANKPIYYISNLSHDYAAKFYGLYYKIADENRTDANNVIALASLLEYWDILLKSEPPWDPWGKIHRVALMNNGCELLTLIEEASAPNMTDTANLERLRTGLCDNLRGSFIMLSAIMQRETPDWDRAGLLLEKAEGQLPEALLKSDISKLDYYKGIMYLKTGNLEKGRYFLEQSLLKWNYPENKAHDELKNINN